METPSKEKIAYVLLAVVATLSCAAFIYYPQIQQDLNYHLFSDQESMCSMPNFLNVVSNGPFLIIGILGIHDLINNKSKKLVTEDFKRQKQLFFIGVALVALGSGYYHWNPNNQTLVWDRLPMTVAFMALFSLIIGTFVNKNLGKKSLIPLITIGFCSVLYWVVLDDLKLYAFVQFYPMVAIPVILLCFNREKKATWGYWLLLLAYLIAKFCEHYDNQIHHTLGIISGHSIKHLVAALGVYCLIYFFKSSSTQYQHKPSAS